MVEPADKSETVECERQLDGVERTPFHDTNVAPGGSSVQAKRCCPDSSDSDDEDVCMRTLGTANRGGEAMLCSLTLHNNETKNQE